MNDDELLRSLRDDVPEQGELFWAGFSRDVKQGIARSAAKRNRLRAVAGIAVVASLALVIGLRPHEQAHEHVPSVSLLPDSEESAGLLVEDLSDEELARVVEAFGKKTNGG